MNERDSFDQLLLQLNTQASVLERADLKQKLASYINHLLLHDFNQLVQLLYRVDVNEQKLKQLLLKNPQTDAADLISELILVRQEEKLKTRQAFKKDEDVNEDDKW
jgi:hypothetical protein